MITEDYVSFEIAKLLKEKGFDEECIGFYVLEEIIPSLQQEQPIQVNTLTWRDINDLERIINNVHYEFRNGIGEKSFGEEVLERFREERDEQEQPEADLKKEYKEYVEDDPVFSRLTNRNVGLAIARHFYELGRNARKED